MGAQVLKVVSYLHGQKLLPLSNTRDPTEETRTLDFGCLLFCLARRKYGNS